MKQGLSVRGHASVHTSVEALVAEHGAWRVLLLALRALALRRERPPGIDVLDEKLRRDIGLPPARPGPRDWHHLR